MNMHKIVLKKVNVSIGKHPILHEIDLTFNSSESYAILGAAGSGKTSLLKTLASKLFPRQGIIQKTGKTEFVPSDYKFHRFVGAVYQYYQQRYHAYDSELGPTLHEVLQNQVKPMGTIDEKSVELDDPLYKEDYLLNIAEKFKINHLLNRKITSLSTGETRRSLLARSVLKNPDFLLLDNPFVGLDSESRNLLSKILEDLEEICVIIVCSRKDRPSFIKEEIYLKNGRVVASLPLLTKDLDPSKKLTEKLKEGKIANFDIAVKFSKANVSYNGLFALKDLDWTVKRGQRWALMGPNGSGKSTIISLITADNPQAYSNNIVLFDHKRGSGESIWDIKKKIGFVSAELQLYCEKDLPVWKLVASGMFDTAGLYQDLTDIELQTVFDYIHLVGIQEIAERKFDQLSTGEQRLAFLARALVKNPPLLILDEPCQGLDYNQMMHFKSIIDFVVPTFSKTLIYVTHYEEELPECIDMRLDISEGKVLLP